MTKQLLRWVPIILIGIVSAFVAFVGLMQTSARADGYPPNCGSTAVVKCGAYSQSELDSRIQPDAKSLYGTLGISTNLSAAKSGTVYPDGTVSVAGDVVATGASTYGRADRTGRDQVTYAGGTAFFKHSIREAAIQRAVDAYVFLDSDGKFIGAILKMCGNPVIAHPKPRPAAACKSLQVDVINRTSVRFSAQASVEDGASINGYKFDITRSGMLVDSVTVDSNETFVTTTYDVEQPGEYKVVLTVKTNIGDKTSEDCVDSFKISEAPVAECVALAVNVVDRVNYRLDATASAENGAEINGYRFEILSTAGGAVVVEKTVNTSASTASIDGTLSEPGDYTAQVYVLTSEGEKTSANCKKQLTIVAAEKKIEVCELGSKKIIVINSDDFDSTLHSVDLSDCQEQEEKSEVLPAELPSTGIGEAVMQAIGLGSMAASGSYYAVSRRSAGKRSDR